MRTALLIVVLLVGLALATIARAEPDERGAHAWTTVVIVRHAETDADTRQTRDPSLSNAGRARARTLAALLRDTNIAAAYTSPYARTRQTLEPTASEFGLEIAEYEPHESAALAKRVLTGHTGQAVLIAGHSNTVPLLIEAFGAERIDDLDHNEYDGLFIVTIAPTGGASLLTLRYEP